MLVGRRPSATSALPLIISHVVVLVVRGLSSFLLAECRSTPLRPHFNLVAMLSRSDCPQGQPNRAPHSSVLRIGGGAEHPVIYTLGGGLVYGGTKEKDALDEKTIGPRAILRVLRGIIIERFQRKRYGSSSWVYAVTSPESKRGATLPCDRKRRRHPRRCETETEHRNHRRPLGCRSRSPWDPAASRRA